MLIKIKKSVSTSPKYRVYSICCLKSRHILPSCTYPCINKHKLWRARERVIDARRGGEGLREPGARLLLCFTVFKARTRTQLFLGNEHSSLSDKEYILFYWPDIRHIYYVNMVGYKAFLVGEMNYAGQPVNLREIKPKHTF